MSDLKPDPVDRALSLLYNASIVSPYLREAAETVTAEVERLRSRVPNPDDLRAIVQHAEDTLEQVRHLRDEGHVATFRKQVARVRATMEEA